MKKELPKVKKSLKTFILNEDAKVIDKTTIKIALVGSLFAIHAFDKIEFVNASTRHSNILLMPSEIDDHWVDGREHIFRRVGLNNKGNETKTVTELLLDVNRKISVPGKSVASAHANHYNHSKHGK